MRRAASFVASAGFLAMFALFVFKIVMRYAAGDAVAWADELSVLLFVWVIFWGCAFVVPDRRQIVFDLVYQALPPGGRRVAAIARTLLIGGLFAAAAPVVFDYLRFLNRLRTPVLQWPLGWVYGCFLLLVASVCVRSAVALVALCGRSWRAAI